MVYATVSRNIKWTRSLNSVEENGIKGCTADYSYCGTNAETDHDAECWKLFYLWLHPIMERAGKPRKRKKFKIPSKVFNRQVGYLDCIAAEVK